MNAELAAAIKGHPGWTEGPHGEAVRGPAPGGSVRVLVQRLPRTEPCWHVAIIDGDRAVRVVTVYGPGRAVTTAELVEL